jgi:exodeoxyribonuclease VII small subunit
MPEDSELRNLSRNSKPPEFEEALTELEALVERLEHGDLPLDEALKVFERGVALTRHCQTALQAAQQKVEILLKRGGELRAEPFEEPGDDDGSAPADPQ